jgi:hypothetical protein
VAGKSRRKVGASAARSAPAPKSASPPERTRTAPIRSTRKPAGVWARPEVTKKVVKSRPSSVQLTVKASRREGKSGGKTR